MTARASETQVVSAINTLLSLAPPNEWGGGTNAELVPALRLLFGGLNAQASEERPDDAPLPAEEPGVSPEVTAAKARRWPSGSAAIVSSASEDEDDEIEEWLSRIPQGKYPPSKKKAPSPKKREEEKKPSPPPPTKTIASEIDTAPVSAPGPQIPRANAKPVRVIPYGRAVRIASMNLGEKERLTGAEREFALMAPLVPAQVTPWLKSLETCNGGYVVPSREAVS